MNTKHIEILFHAIPNEWLSPFMNSVARRREPTITIPQMLSTISLYIEGLAPQLAAQQFSKIHKYELKPKMCDIAGWPQD